MRLLDRLGSCEEADDASDSSGGSASGSAGP